MSTCLFPPCLLRQGFSRTWAETHSLARLAGWKATRINLSLSPEFGLYTYHHTQGFYMVLEIKLRFTCLCSFSLLTEVSFQCLERKFLNTSVWNKINVDIFQVVKHNFFPVVGGDFIFAFCWPVGWEGGWVHWEHLDLLLQLTLMIVFLSD